MKIYVVLVLSLVAVAFADSDDELRLAMENPDLFGGDMAGIDGPFDVERNAIAGDRFRWPGGVVPYIIDPTLATRTTLIQQAFADYHKNTCVKFVPRTNQKDYIKIFAGKGCYSYVGRTGNQQPVSLGNGCHFVGTAVHELAHALGFYHEQNRSDRDEFLTIYINNVQKGMEGNFVKLSPRQNLLLTRFDYDSIMIYGNKSFSKNGQETMVAKNKQRLLDPFHKKGMTKSDIQRVNKMYKC